MEKKQKKRRKTGRFFRVTCFILLCCSLALTIAFCIFSFRINYTMPEIEVIELYDNSNNQILSYCNGKKQSYVKLEEISPYLKQAFISIEDKKFYNHHGLDVFRIGGALLHNLASKKTVEGASTITQQYTRTIFLSNEKTLKRKIDEALIAVHLESIYTKDEILEGYLNAIYFDHGIYGVEDAAIYYFGVKSKSLSLAQATILAAIPKGPTIYSPIQNPENNKKRQTLILDEMKKDGVISDEEYTEAINEKVELLGNNPTNDDINAPYFQDAVLKELESIPEVKMNLSKGIRVYTTLDASIQKDLVESIEKRLPDDELECSAIVMDPKTSEIKALVGGRKYEQSTYNRALYGLRQPGSSIKPFLYLTALEHGFTMASSWKSEETTFYYHNEAYSPHNYDYIYANQNVSMAYALATSDNIYAVKTHLYLGPNELVKTLKKLGITGEIPAIPSLALGSYEVTPLQLTEAYATLASLGKKQKATTIEKVTDFYGNVLYTNESSTTDLFDSSDCYILAEGMRYIFDNSITYNIRPTGVGVRSLFSSIASAKSGSTDTDNWMAGFTPDVCCVVWTGYDDARTITDSIDKKPCKYIWADMIRSYETKYNTTWYKTPDDVVSCDLNPLSGFFPTLTQRTGTFYFKKTNMPWYVNLFFQNQNQSNYESTNPFTNEG